MTRLVDEMLGLHEQKASAAGAELERVTEEIAALDAQIDALVYALYGLIEEGGRDCGGGGGGVSLQPFAPTIVYTS